MAKHKICQLSFCWLLLFVVIAGCSSRANDRRGDRVAVDGIVSVDGTVLKAGRIVYVTNQGFGAVKATASIVEGYYAFTESDGPLPGKARVEIYPQELELEAFDAVRSTNPSKRVDFAEVKIPARYNLRSELEVDVQRDADSNLFSFDLITE